MHYKGKDDKKAIEWANIGAQNDCDMSAFIVANVDEYQNIRMRKKWLKVVIRLGYGDTNKQLEDVRSIDATMMRHVADQAHHEQNDDPFTTCLKPLLKCDAPRWTKRDIADGMTSKKCSRCKHVKYCSKECQKAHWKCGLRQECKKLCNIAKLRK